MSYTSLRAADRDATSDDQGEERPHKDGRPVEHATEILESGKFEWKDARGAVIALTVPYVIDTFYVISEEGTLWLWGLRRVAS
jgi:hypothetical protein